MSTQNTTTPAPQPAGVHLSSLILYSYFTVVLSLSCFGLLYFYSAMRHVRFNISSQLIVHLFLWVACITATLIHVVPIWFTLTTSYVEDNVFFVVLRGSLYFSAFYSIQLSTTFLIISRIQAILFPSLNMPRRRYCQYASVIAFSASYFVIFAVIMQRGYWSAEAAEPDCLTFGCRLGGKLDDLTVYKMFIGTVNIALGAFFVFIYFRFARKASMKKENRKNFTILLILITELLFTVIPNAIFLLAGNALIPFLQFRISMILGIGYTADVLITTMVYWYSWYRIIFPVRIQPAVTILNQKDTRGSSGD